MPEEELILPPSELERSLLKVVWDKESVSVEEAREALDANRPLQYTTVQTMLNRMVAKRLLRREKKGRQFRYFPAIKEFDAQRSALKTIIGRFFSGSASALVTNLIRGGDLSREEARELQDVLRKQADEEKTDAEARP